MQNAVEIELCLPKKKSKREAGEVMKDCVI